MKAIREEPAPDRDAWEKAARESALRLGYEEPSPLVFRRGAAGAFHPDVRKHEIMARWAEGKGTWDATAFGPSPASRRFLEARLDDLQGKGIPGSGLTALARAAVSGVLAWVLATAVLFIFTVPLCRDAKLEWEKKQALFEERLETSRAPTAARVREAPVAQAAFIPAAALAFFVAIPLCLVFALGELLPGVSRWNLPALLTACIVFPMALVSPGVAVPGLVAGVLAPLTAWAVYAGFRALLASGRAPAHGKRWAIGVAAVVLSAGVPATLLSGSDVYRGIRDRALYGTRAGETLATFYYRHTALSSFALRPPELNTRNTLLFAGPIPRGFPVTEYRFAGAMAQNKEDFLKLARGRGYTLLVYNEDGGPWVLEAARELKASDPMRSLEFMAMSRGELEKIFPEASSGQFMQAEALAKSGDARVNIFNAALNAANARADRRHSLRDVARLANSLVVFLGPAVLLGSYGLWVAAGVVFLRGRGLRRAAGALAFAGFAMLAGTVFKVATAEGELQRQLRQQAEEFESIRKGATLNTARWYELDAAAAKALPDLKVAATHPETGVRALAMDALGAAGSHDAFMALGEYVLKDPSMLVRYRAADAIGRNRSRERRINLLSMAQNDEIYVAEAALESMLTEKR
ncbi:MAG: HEAT repeat domain-containing protein [Planctomycetota bacterium]